MRLLLFVGRCGVAYNHEFTVSTGQRVCDEADLGELLHERRQEVVLLRALGVVTAVPQQDVDVAAGLGAAPETSADFGFVVGVLDAGEHYVLVKVGGGGS